MKGLIFLDTETTGLAPFDDRLFQVCYSHEGKRYCQYFTPPVPISIKAQSITHITNKMVADKESFENSQMKKDLQELLKENILVAHNAAFDASVLNKEGIEVPKIICTVKVARYVDEAEEVPEFNLQYLRYFWELEVEGKAHDAEGDVIVLEAIFKKLYGEMMKNFQDHDKVIAKMLEVSTQPYMHRTLSFGKHRGKKIKEVAELDRGYIEWLLKEKMQNPYEEEDWIYTLKHYLNTKPT